MKEGRSENFRTPETTREWETATPWWWKHKSVVVETQEYKLNLDRTQTEGIIYHLITPTVCAPELSP